MRVQLTTTGRRTGERRQATLYGWPDGDRIVIVGSRGGSARDPAWAVNARADPRVRLKVGREEWDATAREVSGPERDRLWDLVCEGFPLYATYQRRTTRLIPLFVVEALDASARVARP
jgi:deazaflavin-dependent oxidoreductase (nitroreductase family)